MPPHDSLMHCMDGVWEREQQQQCWAAWVWACLGVCLACEPNELGPCGLKSLVTAWQSAVGTYHHGPFVVLSVLVLQEDVGGQGPHGVEEGKHSHGDKEFSRGGVVTN